MEFVLKLNDQRKNILPVNDKLIDDKIKVANELDKTAYNVD